MKREDSVTVPATVAEAAVADRRRPGRRVVSLQLLPLLREPGIAPAGGAQTHGVAGPEENGDTLPCLASRIEPSDGEFDAIAAGFAEDADLAGPRGIMLGLALSVPMWAVIILLGRTALRVVL